MLRRANLAAYCGSRRGRCGDGSGIRAPDDAVDALLIEVSTVRVDSIDMSDADGDASVIMVVFSPLGVLGHFRDGESLEEIAAALIDPRDGTPFSIFVEIFDISNIRFDLIRYNWIGLDCCVKKKNSTFD